MSQAPYLKFVLAPTRPGQKTAKWAVLSKSSGDRLGTVRWWSHWRQYVFFPETNTLWNADCMRTVADFTESQTREHRARRAQERADTAAVSQPAGDDTTS